MKAILMSIKPNWVAKILNGEKTIEVRKSFTANYRGWVYIYCTKDKKNQLYYRYDTVLKDTDKENWKAINFKKEWFVPIATTKSNSRFNGKVVARFWCDNVEEIACNCLENGVDLDTYYMTEDLDFDKLEKASCLTNSELRMYLGIGKNIQSDIVGYAIHISKLEIFDEPKELYEFESTKQHLVDVIGQTQPILQNIRLTKAPQSWCYIEAD